MTPTWNDPPERVDAPKVIAALRAAADKLDPRIYLVLSRDIDGADVLSAHATQQGAEDARDRLVQQGHDRPWELDVQDFEIQE